MRDDLYMENETRGDAYCARFHHAVELVGRRWSGAIILALTAGYDRYTDVRGAIPGLSDRMLCDRLRELEAAAIVERVVEASTPVNVRYQLTAKGRALEPVLNALSVWAQEWNGSSLPSREPR